MTGMVLRRQGAELMPLQDSFKRRPTQTTTEQTRPSVTPLRGSPTIEELRFSMQRAQDDPGRPVILSWRSNDKQVTFLLTVTTGSKALVPTWMLHQGSEENSVVVWVYTTPDTELIRTLILGVDREDTNVIAEIPEHLKPPDPLTDPLLLQAPLPTEEFADRYEILSRVGQGGMGMVYKVKHRQKKEFEALKVLHSHLLTDLESKRRFEQEASSCKGLSHRNVLAVHEFGFSKHGQPFMTMEFLDGKSLSSILNEQGRLELRYFINVFTQICDGLHHAHLQGLVHRDIKPGNIMICKNPEKGVELVKIVDFGIAKHHMVRNQEQITPTGNVLGSPAYIAPEQCAGAEADPRSDVYSLGCVMYESLTGQPPFFHDNPIKVLMMQLSEPTPPFNLTCPELDLPAELEEVIMRCLEKDPVARYQTAEDVAVDLWTFAATGQLASREAGAAPPAGVTPQSAISLPASVQEAKAAPVMEQPAAVRKRLALRFKRFRGPSEMDVVWEGLLLARTMADKGLAVTMLLELEAVGLVCKPDVVQARYHLDTATMKKLITMQSLLQSLMKAGVEVRASSRWAKHWSENPKVMPGVKLISDDELADTIIEHTGSILDY
ncbi:MAG: serine/threonine protein kinase [Candidatus Obscuribacterales bacterium]|nr:serine/threonine protein kinase [Candidatus Obscuribacterales bacterium]